jgi:putative oxidoreductase
MDIILIIGRVLFALILLSSGLNHFKHADHMAGYAGSKGVPAAKQSVLLSGLLMALGSLSIILGVYADLGALVMALLLLAMAVKMHDFWKADEASKQSEMINFFKNVSMAGGALVMFAAIAGATKGADVLGPMLTDGLFASAAK